MFDKDLAELYGVETKTLNRAVKRNLDRFPGDFMFQLNKKEASVFLRFQNGTSNENLKYQIGTSSWGGRRKLPYVFTEQGVAMLSAVLKSKTAIKINIQIIRTFVKMRDMLATHKELREKVEQLEKNQTKNFKIIFEILARLMKEDALPQDKIGFK